MLSIICNYFPLGVAVSASLLRKAKAQECQETLGARHLPLHQAGCRQRKPALGPILTDRVLQCRRNRHPLESRRRGALPPAFQDRSAPRSRPPPARGSRAEPRTHHRSSPGLHRPPWPLRAPGRRQVQTSPGLRGGGEGHRRRGSAALNNGRLGRALRLRAVATAPAARRSRGLNPSTGHPECAGAPDNHASPPLGPRGRGALARARHQVIPQEASRIGRGAQDAICMSMAEKAP